MTEAEWDVCTDPQATLAHVRCSKRATDRKLRLFAVACCRRTWPHLPDDRNREAVEVAERWADGLAGEDELAAFGVGGLFLDPEMTARCPRGAGGATLYSEAWYAASYAAQEAARHVHKGRKTGKPGRRPGRVAERTAQCHLARDLFGNPFRPLPALAPSLLDWHGGAILKLAQAIYEERELPSGHLDAARLAVLADMLEEAGATDAQLLEHLRGPGPHVRGCHSLDLILSKDR